MRHGLPRDYGDGLFDDGAAGALDELDALRSRNAALEIELEDARNEIIDLSEQIDELRQELAA